MPSEPLQGATAALARGGVIAHPTETLFGLAVDPDNPEALARLTALKGRGESKGFILLIPDRSALVGIVSPEALVHPLVQSLMDQFWPGPLTLVLPACSVVSPLLTGGRGTIAVRHSSSELVQNLMACWGKPLVSTSANRTGDPPLWDHRQVVGQFADQLDWVVPGSCPERARPSTLVEVVAGECRILRQGDLAESRIIQAVSRGG